MVGPVPEGIANERFSAEQDAMVAQLALADGGNGAAVGGDGELLVTDFLNRYLPPQLRAQKGHYRKTDGTLSREIDVMVLDSRFPILNETRGGIVHALQHAVLCVVEVKRTLGGREVAAIRKDVLALESDHAQPSRWTSAGWGGRWRPPAALALAYRSDGTLETLAGHMFRQPAAWCDVFVLRHGHGCGGAPPGVGALIRVEGTPDDYTGMTCRTVHPLSDFYYMLVQQAFEALADRAIPDNAVGRVINAYYSWGTLRDTFSLHRFKDPA